MFKKLGLYILSNRNQAALVAFLSAFIPYLGISSIILGLVTLRKGSKEGLWILLWVSVPDVVMALMGHTDSLFFRVLGFSVYTWAIASVLRQSSSWSTTLEVAALLSLVGVIAVHLYFPGVVGWWAAQYNQMLDTVSIDATTKAQILQSAQLQDWQQFIDTVGRPRINMIASVTSGFVATLVMCSNLIALAIARWWQATLFNPGGLRKELYQIRLSYRAIVALGICIAIALMGISSTLDLLPVLLGIFFVAGISVLHCYFSNIKRGLMWLVLFYVLLVFQPDYLILLLIGVALTDSVFNIRQHFLKLT